MSRIFIYPDSLKIKSRELYSCFEQIGLEVSICSRPMEYLPDGVQKIFRQTGVTYSLSEYILQVIVKNAPESLDSHMLLMKVVYPSIKYAIWYE